MPQPLTSARFPALVCSPPEAAAYTASAWKRLIRTKFSRCLYPVPRALFGIGVQRHIGASGGAVCACFEDSIHALQRNPADGNERDVADSFLPFGDARQALRGKGHGFQNRRIDGAERDVIWLERQGAAELFLIMGGHTQTQTSAADCGKIGGIEIALAEMDEIASSVDSLLPIIIHDQLRAVTRAEG